jgi:hypothetical protein
MLLVRGTYRGTIGELRGTIGELHFGPYTSSPKINAMILKEKVIVRGTRNLGEAEITLLKISGACDLLHLSFFSKKKNSLFVVICLLIVNRVLYISINYLVCPCGRFLLDRGFHVLGTDEKSGIEKPQYLVIYGSDNIVSILLFIFINSLCLLRMSDTCYYVKYLKNLINTPPRKHSKDLSQVDPITRYKLDHYCMVLYGFRSGTISCLFDRYRKVGGPGGVQ